MRSGSHCAFYADASPGDRSLVSREFTQSLGARLLVLVLQAVGAIFNLFYICFTLDNRMMVRSTVIFTAVSYDVFILMYNYSVCIYVNMFAQRAAR